MNILDKIEIPDEIDEALREGALLAISVSGGKDSDAMMRVLPILYRQRGWSGRIVLVHADLGRMEWDVTPAYVDKRQQQEGLSLYIVRRNGGDLLDQMEARHIKRPDAPPFPSGGARYCTSDNKRNVLSTLGRRLVPDGVIVFAVGLRAQESRKRAQKPVFEERGDMTTLARKAYNWHPLLRLTTEDVWSILDVTPEYLAWVRAEVQPYKSQPDRQAVYDAVERTGWRWHPAYAIGNERVSCALCVLANESDLRNGAMMHPDLFHRLVALENLSGFSFTQKTRLSDFDR